MDVVVPLANALRYGDVRGTDGGALRDVFDGIVVRILAGLVPACSSLDDDAAARTVERLTGHADGARDARPRRSPHARSRPSSRNSPIGTPCGTG